MKSRKELLLIITTLVVFTACLYPQKALKSPYYVFPRESGQHINLTKDWELSYQEDTIQHVNEITNNDWFLVENPTSVQMAMFKSGKLPDPYVGMNATLYEEFEQKVWYYKKSFVMPSSLEGSSTILSFGGIDYYSKIWLNGELLGTHEGMYGTGIDITQKVRAGQQNEIIIQVLSANYQYPEYAPRRPGKVIKTWFFTGGSGVEPFFHLGMWQGARIDILPFYHIERPFLFTKQVMTDTAVLELQMEIFSGKNSLDYALHPRGNTTLGTYHSPLSPKVVQNIQVEDDLKVVIKLSKSGKIHFQKEFHPYVIKGRSWIEEEISIPNPELWYPNGMGEQNLYEVSISLEVNNKTTDVIRFDYGIRTIEQIRSAGIRTQDRWANWQFVINGEKQFIKGINWMPLDALSDLQPEKYEWLIAAAKNAGIQLFRIWGAGYMETEDFYDLCDKHGIMVWQDFPMGNFDTPEWNQEDWQELVCRNIFRLRNRASLAVWCGGNEFNPYSTGTTAIMGVLERNLREFDPTRLFLRTTPDHGSMHAYPDFDPNWYKAFDLIPFVAETGIHSMTDARGNKEVINLNELKSLNNMADSSFLKDHPEFILHFAEYSPNRVPRMLSRASHILDLNKASYEELVEASQVGAGEFYQVMSESFQANYPVTTGLMPWTYNRPWPVVAAINLIDGFGQPSAPYYFLKNTYEKDRIMIDLPRMLWKPEETIPLKVKILNPGQMNMEQNKIVLSILDQQFKELYKQERKTLSGTEEIIPTILFDSFTIPEKYRQQYFFLIAELQNQAGELISRSVYWTRTINQLDENEYYNRYLSEPMPWPELKDGPWLKPIVAKNKTTIRITDCKLDNFNGTSGELSYTITNTGSYPAFMCTFEIENVKRKFFATDNYYWLESGESKTVKVYFQLREAMNKNQLALSFQAWNAKSVKKSMTLK